MKIDKSFIASNFIGFLCLVTTFFLHYEYLFITRIVLIIFTMIGLMISIKKEFFSVNKKIFVLLSVVIMLAIIASILFDNTLPNSGNSDRDFLIPVFAFTLIVTMYKDLYDEKNKSEWT